MSYAIVTIPLILASVYGASTILKIPKVDSLAKHVAITFFILSLVALMLMEVNAYQSQINRGVDVDFKILIPEFISKVLFSAFAAFMLFLWQRLTFNFNRRKFIKSIKMAALFSLGLAIIEITLSSLAQGSFYLGFDPITGIAVNAFLWSAIFFSALDRKIDAWSYSFAFLYLIPEILWFAGRASNFYSLDFMIGEVSEKALELALLFVLINLGQKKEIKAKK